MGGGCSQDSFTGVAALVVYYWSTNDLQGTGKLARSAGASTSDTTGQTEATSSKSQFTQFCDALNLSPSELEGSFNPNRLCSSCLGKLGAFPHETDNPGDPSHSAICAVFYPAAIRPSSGDGWLFGVFSLHPHGCPLLVLHDGHLGSDAPWPPSSPNQHRILTTPSSVTRPCGPGTSLVALPVLPYGVTNSPPGSWPHPALHLAYLYKPEPPCGLPV